MEFKCLVPNKIVNIASKIALYNAVSPNTLGASADAEVFGGVIVLKAMAMGAKGTYIGRSFIYGLGAMGQQGVQSALEVIHKELDTSMALCGETQVNDLGAHNLLIPEDFEGRWQN